MLFDVQTSEEDGWSVLALTGELDLAAAPAVRSHVVALTGAGVTRLVIDLSGVDFLDSAGLGVLVGARKRVRQADEVAGEVRLVVPEPRLRRLLTLTGLDLVFPLFDERAEAVAAPLVEAPRG
jgi:anti-sigma B factor antagonist